LWEYFPSSPVLSEEQRFLDLLYKQGAGMSACNDRGVRILGYLDDDLAGQELAEFRAHLEHCPTCQASIEAERSLSQLLRRSRPIYSAPPALRARVAAAVERHAASARVRAGSYEWVIRVPERGFADPAGRVVRLRLFVACLAATAMLLAFGPNFMRHVRAADYVETAVATHRSYLEGNLSLELHSDSPEQVTGWFSGKVPFPFRLPMAQVAADNPPAYRLTGASVVQYRGKPAALVTYRRQNQKISLLVVSADSAVVAGGDEVHFGDLTFHDSIHQGFKVITWRDHGLSYALVSSVPGPAGASCLVCHQNMAGSRNFNVPQ
jgi:mycothiol system anti-sigma-R factor